MTTQLNPVSVEDKDGKVILHMASDSGEKFDLPLSTLFCQSLIQMLKQALLAAASSPPPEPLGVMHLSHMQLREYEGMLLVRMAISPQVFHDYDLPLNTTLAQDLLAAVHARQVAQTTHSGSETKN